MLQPTQLVDRTENAAIATDHANRLLGWNAAAEELLDLDRRGAKPGDPFHNLIEARDSFGNRLDNSEAMFLGMIHRGEPVRGFELLAVDAEGERVRCSVSPVVLLGDSEDPSVVYFLRRVLRRRRADEVIERILAAGDLAGLDVSTLRRSGARAKSTILTRRQVEALRLMADGSSVGEMAKSLGVSVSTVRTHISHILQRLKVHSRAEAVSIAFREGLI